MGLAAVVATLIVESYVGSTRYQINGVGYDVPHKYEFMRNFRIPFLAKLKGLDKEPNESVWLLFPAEQLAQGIPGYSRWFHGYGNDVEADMVVNVLGGKEAREFPGDRRNDMAKVVEELAKKSTTRPDALTGWVRVYWSVGEKGTPGEGNDLFYLIPPSGVGHLPRDWRVPYCQSSPDINRRETYVCDLTIARGGRMFGFYIRQENLRVASQIPQYVEARLNRWRT
jgi:hypothetical protein